MTSKNSINRSQIDRFKKAARKLEADEREAAFDEKMKVLSKQKPAEHKKLPE